MPLDGATLILRRLLSALGLNVIYWGCVLGDTHNGLTLLSGSTDKRAEVQC
jgi:hypothetical protein